MNIKTISEVDITLEINKNVRMTCKLKRHLSPITVGLITRMLPMEGNAHKIGESIVYFETKINSGIERKRTDFKKGDIAFLPTEGSICFYMDDISDGKPMTIIGKIIDGIEKLSEMKSSDVLSLSRN